MIEYLKSGRTLPQPQWPGFSHEELDRWVTHGHPRHRAENARLNAIRQKKIRAEQVRKFEEAGGWEGEKRRREERDRKYQIEKEEDERKKVVEEEARVLRRAAVAAEERRQRKEFEDKRRAKREREARMVAEKLERKVRAKIEPEIREEITRELRQEFEATMRKMMSAFGISAEEAENYTKNESARKQLRLQQLELELEQQRQQSRPYKLRKRNAEHHEMARSTRRHYVMPTEVVALRQRMGLPVHDQGSTASSVDCGKKGIVGKEEEVGELEKKVDALDLESGN